MEKYYITIYFRESGCVSNLVRNEEDVNSCIEKELGGWDNIQHHASTGFKGSHPKEYGMAGCTKDNSKVFSIICVVSENPDITKKD